METIPEIKKVVREIPTGFYIRQRYVLAFLGFMGHILISSIRNCVNVTIISMTQAKEINQSTALFNDSTAVNENFFAWSGEQEGLFLGSYFYGYICTNIFGGWLGKKFGPRKVFGLLIFLSAVFHILTPVFAHMDFYLVIIIRIIVGALQGSAISSFQCCWATWAPPLELSILNAITLSGIPLGISIVYPLSGFVCKTLGWEPVFYIVGAVTIFWSIVWIVVVSDSPHENRFISEAELTYLRNTTVYSSKKTVKHHKLPLRSMLTSRSSLVICVSHFCDNWTGYTLNAVLPTYMAKMFQFDILQSGAVMTLPYVAQFLVGIIVGYVTDFARQHGWVKTSLARKINNFVALGVLNVFIISASYSTDVAVAIVLFGMGLSINGFASSGYLANIVDIAPLYAGLLFGVSNTIGSIPGFIGPLTAGIVVKDKTSVNQWQVLFWINAAVGLFGSLLFACFASGSEREWAKEKGRQQCRSSISVKKIDENEMMLD